MKSTDMTDVNLWAELGRRMQQVHEKKSLDVLLNKLNHTIEKLERMDRQEVEKWYSVNEVLEYLDISQSTFREWRIEGLRAATVGRKVYVSQSEINRFLTERQI